MTAGEVEFHRFANELSRNLPLISTLLDAHGPAGPCRGCILPGPQAAPPSPCPVRCVALLALQIRVLRETDAAVDTDAATLCALRDECAR